MPDRSTNETETPDSNIEDQQRIHGNTDSVPNDTRATQDADAGSQRPSDEHEIDGDASNNWEVHCAEKSGDDEWEQSVSDDANRLEKGTIRFCQPL